MLLKIKHNKKVNEVEKKINRLIVNKCLLYSNIVTENITLDGTLQANYIHR